jgi:thiol-disulfide isomerase/thioredoxin
MLLIWISSFGMIEFQHATRQSIAWLTFASIPFTLFSLYYQGRVIKKWCISCLLILSILWIMAIMQGFQVFNLALINGLRTAAILGVFILPGSIWVWVKNLLIHKQELGSSRLVLQQFYRNPELFETYVLNQEKVDIPSWSFDFQIGNADAPCELVVVSSLFCGPCVDTYKILQNLLKKHEGQLSIRIRFLVDNKGKLNGLKGSVARYMLAYAVSTDNFLQQPQKVEQMLQTWYSVTDMEKFSKLYPLTTDIDVEDLLRQQREWFQSVNIRFTPTIFINGYPLNSPYTQTDLLEFSGTLLDMFSSEGLEYASHADPIHINQV